MDAGDETAPTLCDGSEVAKEAAVADSAFVASDPDVVCVSGISAFMGGSSVLRPNV